MRRNLVLVIVSFFLFEFLVLMCKPATSISYGIPPTNGKHPITFSSSQDKFLEIARETLSDVYFLQAKAFTRVKFILQKRWVQEFAVETNFHNLKVQKLYSKTLRDLSRSLGGTAIGNVVVDETETYIVGRNGQIFRDSRFGDISILGKIPDVFGDSKNIFGIRDTIILNSNASHIHFVSSYTFVEETQQRDCFRFRIFSWSIAKHTHEQKVNFERDLYRNSECVNPSMAHVAGIGLKLALYSNELLVSIGEMNEVHLPNSAYGSVLSVNVATGESFVMARGFRNPSGITVVENRIYISNQGPRGGDFLTLAPKDSDYGWPEQSFGTEYAFSGYPNSKNSDGDNQFSKPDIIFTPTLAISDVKQSKVVDLDFWQNSTGTKDLIGTSLKAEQAFHCRISPIDYKVLYCETFYLGERLRSADSNREALIVLGDSGSLFRIAKS